MPVQTTDGGPNGFFDVLRDPPVIFFFEVADGDQARTAANSKFVLFWAPFYASSSAIDTQDYQGRFPYTILYVLIPPHATKLYHDNSNVN